MASRYTHTHAIRSCGDKYAYRWPVSLDENVVRPNPSAPCMSVCIVQNSPDHGIYLPRREFAEQWKFGATLLLQIGEYCISCGVPVYFFASFSTMYFIMV